MAEDQYHAEDVSEKIRRALNEGSLIENAPMSGHTSFRAGGQAAWLVMPRGEIELEAVLEIAESSRIPWAVMGNGTNILVRDGGFTGIIIQIKKGFDSIRVEGDEIRAGAGALLSDIANAALGAGLTGFEFAGGIPGSLGGAIYMNAGAYGGEISAVLSSVRLLVPLTGGGAGQGRFRVIEAGVPELRMSYRYSSLQDGGAVALGAVIRLRHGNRRDIRVLMSEYARRRAEKQPLDMPSAGSFFKRPSAGYAGKMIQDAGLRGLSRGGARVSELHGGFIVNAGGATAKDITDLMEAVQDAVRECFGVELEPEVRIIGELQDGI